MEQAPKKMGGVGKVLMGVLFCLALLFGAWFLMPKGEASRSACVNNLLQIDGAKEQWALEKKKPAGSATVVAEVNEFIKGGEPRCPSGGNYVYGNVDSPPTCSLGGNDPRNHSLAGAR